MFVIIVNLKVKDRKDTDYVKKCLADVSRITLSEEPCCKRLDVYQSENDDSTFILYENWDARKDWEEHRNKTAFKEIYAPKVLPLVERAPHICNLVK
ncbi:MAG: antibiotic biosynthesis monooxygenase [Deltaproteobacteria bacterium]|nr:antibiotic biosynthesis monooxygenase [Deltaproteobacteria bacterium]